MYDTNFGTKIATSIGTLDVDIILSESDLSVEVNYLERDNGEMVEYEGADISDMACCEFDDVFHIQKYITKVFKSCRDYIETLND